MIEEEKKTSDEDGNISKSKPGVTESDGSQDEINSNGDNTSNSSSSSKRGGYTADCSSDCSDSSSSSLAEAQDAAHTGDKKSVRLWKNSDSQNEEQKKAALEGSKSNNLRKLTEPKLKEGHIRDVEGRETNGHLSMSSLDSNQNNNEQINRKSLSPVGLSSGKQNPEDEISTLVANPMEATIDLSSVKLVPASVIDKFKHSRCSTIKAMEGSESSCTNSQASKKKKKQDFSVKTSGDFYAGLLETCRPFYAYTTPLDVGSSDKIQNSGDNSESSMAVLARTRRKHRKVHQIGSHPSEKRNEYRDLASQGSKQLESHATENSASDKQKIRDNTENDSIPASKRNKLNEAVDIDNAEKLSSSSNSLNDDSASSSSRRANALLYQLDTRAQKPRPQGDMYADQNLNDQGQRSINDCRSRVVSDTMGSSNNGSTGTGSGNDTLKKSSTENSAESNSGDGNSDEYRTKKDAASSHENQHSLDPRDFKISIQQTDEDVSANGEATTATQERLAEKKRKRLDRRREYEEEVQKQLQDPSESVEDNGKMIVPGEPLTIEEAISLTNVARFVFVL